VLFHDADDGLKKLPFLAGELGSCEERFGGLGQCFRKLYPNAPQKRLANVNRLSQSVPSGLGHPTEAVFFTDT